MASARQEKVAKRYARALFEVTQPQDFDATLRQLERLTQVWGASVEYRDSMLNPRVSDSQRLSVVDGVAQFLGGWVNEPTKKMVQALVELRKAHIVPSVATIFAQLVSEYRKSLALEVTFAQPVNDDVVSGLRGRLFQALGGEVALNVKTDPSLLGGLTIRLGDKLLDRSVAGALQRIAIQVTR